MARETCIASTEGMHASRLRGDVDQKLEQAFVLGDHLVTILANFEKEVSEWRKSIAHLRGGEVPMLNKENSQSTAVASAGPLKSDVKRGSYWSSKDSKESRNGDKPDLHPQLWEFWASSGISITRLASGNRIDDTGELFRSKSGYQAPDKSAFRFLNRFVVDPASGRTTIIHSLGMLFLIYDLVAIPLAAFGYNETRLSKDLRLLITVYWTVDVIASLFTGYITSEGHLEKRFGKACRYYLRSRQARFDLCVVSIDWVSYLVDYSKALTASARLGRFAGLFRLLRLVRLLRIGSLQKFIEWLKSFPIFIGCMTFFDVASSLCHLMMVNHFLGCSWYAIGLMSGSENTWIQEYVDPDATALERYLISFQWCIAQYTPAPVNVFPVNLHERIYAAVILFFGLVFFASLLGNVTAIINQSRKTWYETFKARNDLNAFLSNHDVPVSLSHRVSAFLKMRRIQKSRVLESDVPMLETLPSSMRQKLHLAIHGPVLKRHALFDYLSVRHGSHDTVVHICHAGVTVRRRYVGDEIFHYRSKCDNMMMPMSGTLLYRVGHAGQSEHHSQQIAIDSRGWLSEVALWISWQNRGSLVVGDECELLTIDCKKLQKIASKHTSSLPLLRRYALLIARTMTRDAETHLIDDLWGSSFGIKCEMSEILACVDSLDKAFETMGESEHNADEPMAYESVVESNGLRESRRQVPI